MDSKSGHIKADIPSYLNGDLGETRIRQIDIHVAECDACRHALSKARSKQSRVKRAALKNAQPEKMPNLLVARLGRQEGIMPRPRRGISWGTIFVLLTGLGLTGGWYLHRSRPAMGGGPLAGTPDESSSEGAGSALSTGTAAGFEVRQSSADTPVRGTPPAAPHHVEIQWQGVDSPIHLERQVVLRNSAAWKVLWLEMEKGGDAPAIDFDDKIIIGLFAGEYPDARYQVAFGAPVEREDDVLVSYSVLRSSSAIKTPAPAHPYLLQVIPKSPKRIRFSLASPQ